jgi:hypothetical protein
MDPAPQSLKRKSETMPSAVAKALRTTLLLGAFLMFAPAPAAAQAPTPVAVRTGQHPGYSRLVFDFPAGVTTQVDRQGATVTLGYTGQHMIDVDPVARRPVGNVLGLAASPGRVTVTVPPEARLRHFRLGNRLVLDVLDAGGPPAAPPPPAPVANAQPAPPSRARTPEAATQPPPAAPPVSAAQRAVAARPSAAAPVPLAAAPQPAEPAPAASQATTNIDPEPAPPPPAALRSPSNNLTVEEAAPVPPPSYGPIALAVHPLGDSAIAVPSNPRAGLAVFRRGSTGWVVLDEVRPLDLALLRGNRFFGAAEVTLVPALAPTNTVLRLPLEPGKNLRARRDGARWIIELTDDASASQPMGARVDATGAPRLQLPAGQVGRANALHDPATGETLLVGTVRDPALGVAPARAYAAFALPPTASGILVVPTSDTVRLRALADGFAVLAGPAGAVGLPLAAADEGAAVAAAGLTRSFDFAAIPDIQLAERARRLTGEAGSVPPLARGRVRVDMAETLLGLGLAAEASGTLALTANEDPATGGTARLKGLSGIAALLSDRLDESDGLADPRLDGTDEIAMWRALRALALGANPGAHAPVLAATGMLAATYPAGLKFRATLLAAEGMAKGGEPDAALRLLRLSAVPDEAAALPRGLALAAKNDVDGALEAFEMAANGRDRLARAKAIDIGTELALKAGRIDAAEAAKRLDAALFAWRGDGREIAQRMRIADLRQDAGDPRGALQILRETASLFPEEAARVRPGLDRAFHRLFQPGPDGKAEGDALPPSQAVALFEDNADLLPAGPVGGQMTSRLAERLLQLDLPQRAAALVARVMDAQAEGPARATLGARLATLRLADADPAGALAALAASDAPNLPAALSNERRVLEARAMAEQGDVPRALARLAGLPGAASLDLQATLLASTGDWAGAIVPLQALASQTLPATPGALDLEQRRTLLRLAAAAALSGRNDVLAKLARERGAAMAEGPLSAPFKLLTSDPVRGLADLPRIASELQLARALPRSLAAVEAPAAAR